MQQPTMQHNFAPHHLAAAAYMLALCNICGQFGPGCLGWDMPGFFIVCVFSVTSSMRSLSLGFMPPSFAGLRLELPVHFP